MSWNMAPGSTRRIRASQIGKPGSVSMISLPQNYSVVEKLDPAVVNSGGSSGQIVYHIAGAGVGAFEGTGIGHALAGQFETYWIFVQFLQPLLDPMIHLQNFSIFNEDADTCRVTVSGLDSTVPVWNPLTLTWNNMPSIPADAPTVGTKQVSTGHIVYLDDPPVCTACILSWDGTFSLVREDSITIDLGYLKPNTIWNGLVIKGFSAGAEALEDNQNGGGGFCYPYLIDQGKNPRSQLQVATRQSTHNDSPPPADNEHQDFRILTFNQPHHLLPWCPIEVYNVSPQYNTTAPDGNFSSSPFTTTNIPVYDVPDPMTIRYVANNNYVEPQTPSGGYIEIWSCGYY